MIFLLHPRRGVCSSWKSRRWRGHCRLEG